VDHLLTIPHHPAAGLCPVNGIRDLVHWRTGRDWSNEFLYGLGQGGGFAYLRFKFADPPRQVYWGTASSRQHKYLAELLGAPYAELENKTFNYSWKKAVEALDEEAPPILGPLDMYYLHFYPEIYHQRHIPIHYLLLVGYDGNNAYVHDTGLKEVQTLPLDELQLAWDVNVPGLGKRNRLAILTIPTEIASTNSCICRSIRDQSTMMLKPPVSMLGIPAMQKLSREIAHWPQELGVQTAERCARQVREYLNSPPDLSGQHLTAGRDIYVTFLEQAAAIVGLDFSIVINRFRSTLDIIPKIADSIEKNDFSAASSGFANIAKIEQEAYTLLLKSVGDFE
jgi:hypothetical protein